MRIKNKKSGREFDITEEAWQNDFVNKGNSAKYDVVPVAMPQEVKAMMKKSIELKPLKEKKNKKNDN